MTICDSCGHDRTDLSTRTVYTGVANTHVTSSSLEHWAQQTAFSDVQRHDFGVCAGCIFLREKLINILFVVLLLVLLGCGAWFIANEKLFHSLSFSALITGILIWLLLSIGIASQGLTRHLNKKALRERQKSKEYSSQQESHLRESVQQRKQGLVLTVMGLCIIALAVFLLIWVDEAWILLIVGPLVGLGLFAGIFPGLTTFFGSGYRIVPEAIMRVSEKGDE
jgi:multisubunit Na+/H+ antiporter MnhC subunit